jgi:putative membrane protein
MLRQFALCLAVMVLAGCSESMSQLGGKASPELSTGDNHFFKVVANANDTEVKMSQMALAQSQNAQVRQFAQHMIDDHTQAGKQVQALASQKDVVLPQQLDTIHQDLVDGLRGKTGADFDRAFMSAQVTAHQDTINNVKAEADNGSDQDVKQLAQQLLPKLQDHLRMAQQVQSGL